MKPARRNTTRPPEDVSHLRLIRTPNTAPAKKKVVVIGAGMVAQKLCERFEALEVLNAYDVTVLGDEPCYSYDRVNLTSMLRGSSLSDLQLQPRDWYLQRKIQLYVGDAVESIDTEHKSVATAGGREVVYDKLVFATGSSPILPKLDGNDLPRVQVYRTGEDVEALEELICSSRELGHPIAIVGAGLLGLEVAEAVMERSASVVLIEAAERILPKQLSGQAAERARQILSSAGYEIVLGTRLREIRAREDGAVTISTDPVDDRVVAGVVFATGVRPRDELARRSRLRCDMYGGIEVDDALQTSHPDVFAIGECARHAGVAYGLVAPGYEMAEVLARRLSGDESWSFRPQQTVTRLKMQALEVSAVGRSFVEGSDVHTFSYEDESTLRTLVLEGETVVGASAIGPWPEFVDLSGAIARGDALKSKHLDRFERGLPVWGDGRRRLDRWPDETVICSCTGVNCGSLRAARNDGCRTAELLTERTSAGSVCGTCVPTLRLLAGEVSEVEEKPPGPALWATACVALLAVAVVSSAPPIEFSKSFATEWQLDELWRDRVLKQASGYSLLGLFALAAAFSARKRLSRFNLGSIGSWRLVHSMIGAAAVTGTVLHTGMRLGHNLDFALMVTVLAVTSVGAGASLAVALGCKWSPDRAASLRRIFTRLHIWTTWPLPILLAVHIFRAYYF